MPPSRQPLARYIPVIRLFESLGGSQGYEKDPASYGDALKKQLTDHISEDDELAVQLCRLLKGPKELEGGQKVTMADLLRGIERLGGSKSFEEHVRKLESAEPQVDQIGLKKPDDIKDSASSGPDVIMDYAYSNYAHLSCWTVIVYTYITITADISGTTYVMNGGVWGIGGSFSIYEAGKLNYNNFPAGNPDLKGDVDVSQRAGYGFMLVTSYKDGYDYCNFVGVAGLSIGIEISVTGSGTWTH